MVSQETHQKGYLLGLVLNGMNKTLEITLQEIILHWQGNSQDNLISLFISKQKNYRRKYPGQHFFSLTWALIYTQISLYPAKSSLQCEVKLGPAHKEVKGTVHEIFCEEQMFTTLGGLGRSIISSGMTSSGVALFLLCCLLF